jgi:hypothetical protein
MASNTGVSERNLRFLVIAVLLVAALIRLRGIAYGLPALYDPDEPVFMMNAAKLLYQRTLNPGWFGHPGTTTIYALLFVQLVVLMGGMALGYFQGPQDYATQAYFDPTITFLSGRLFILACAIGCILLVFLIARRLFGDVAGLLAAALLAINPLHVGYSQAIRTDMHASVFVLLCILWSIRIIDRGRRSDYLWAGVWIGLACATKWPAALVAAAPAAACWARCHEHRGELRRQVQQLVLGFALAGATLFLVSPFLILDYPRVFADLRAEVDRHHVGASGRGLVWNLWWYVRYPLYDAVGPVGIAAAAVGAWIAARSRRPAAALLAYGLCFALGISFQNLVWTRWIVPLLPIVAILQAAAVVWLFRVVRARMAPRAALATAAVCAAAIAVPMVLGIVANTRERLNDTRALATQWARAHVPPGRSIAIEHLAFDMLPHGWRLMIPAGDVGCVDGAKVARGKVSYDTVRSWAAGRSVVYFGTMSPRQLETCRSDYLITTQFDRFLSEKAAFPAEVAGYQALTSGGELMATFSPQRGHRGGPVIRIYRMHR